MTTAPPSMQRRWGGHRVCRVWGSSPQWEDPTRTCAVEDRDRKRGRYVHPPTCARCCRSLPGDERRVPGPGLRSCKSSKAGNDAGAGRHGTRGTGLRRGSKHAQDVSLQLNVARAITKSTREAPGKFRAGASRCLSCGLFFLLHASDVVGCVGTHASAVEIPGIVFVNEKLLRGVERPHLARRSRVLISNPARSPRWRPQ